MNKDKVRKVYDLMSAKYDMTQSYDEFEPLMDNEEKRRKVYDLMSAKYDMTQSYDEFSNALVGDAVDSATQANQNVMESITPTAQPTTYQPMKADDQFLTDEDKQSIADTAEVSNSEVRRGAQAMQNMLGARPTMEQYKAAEQTLFENLDNLRQFDETKALNKQRGMEIADPLAKGYMSQAEKEKEQVRQEREEMKQLDKDYLTLTQAAHDYATSKYGPMPSKLSSEEGWGKAYQEYLDSNDPTGIVKAYNDNDTRRKRSQTLAFQENMANQLERRARQTLRQAERGTLGNVAGGIGYGLAQPTSWSLGLSDLWTAENVLSLANKLNSGEPLTDYEQNALDAYGTYMEALQTLGQYDTRAFKAGQTTGQMAPFFVQMGLNPASGLGTRMATKATGKAVKNLATKEALATAEKAGQTLTQEAAERIGQYEAEQAMRQYAEKGAREVLRKYGKDAAQARAVIAGSRIAGDLGAAAVLANTLQAGTTARNVIERKLGDPIKDGENYTFDPNRDVSWARAFYQGEAAEIIEDFTEMMGEWKVMGLADKLNKFTGDKVSRVVRALGNGEFAKGLDNMLKNSAFSGTLFEMLEEEYGILLNSILHTGDGTYGADFVKQMGEGFSLDQQLDILLGIGLFGGMVAGAKMGAYPVEYVNSRNRLNEATTNARELWGKDWDKMQESIDSADETTLRMILGTSAERIRKANESGQTPDGRDLRAVEYISALQRYRGLNIARDLLPGDEDTKTMQEFYLHGWDGADKQAVKSAYEHYKQQLELIDPELVPILETSGIDAEVKTGTRKDENGNDVDVKQKIFQGKARVLASDYLNAKAAFDGMLQGIQDRALAKAREARAIVEQNDNQGRQIEATLRTGEKVHIIDGQIEMAGGAPILNDPRSSIVVRYEDGKKEMLSPMMVQSIDNVQNTEQVARMASDAAAQESIMKEAMEADNSDPIANAEAVAATEVAQEEGRTAYEDEQIITLPDGSVGHVVVASDPEDNGNVVIEWDENPNGRDKIEHISAQDLYALEHQAAPVSDTAPTAEVQNTEDTAAPTPEQLAYDEWVKQHGDNAENKMNVTRAYAEEKLSEQESQLAEVNQELLNLPAVQDDETIKKQTSLEKKKGELEASIANYQAVLGQMNSIKSVFDAQNGIEPVAEEQTPALTPEEQRRLEILQRRQKTRRNGKLTQKERAELAELMEKAGLKTEEEMQAEETKAEAETRIAELNEINKERALTDDEQREYLLMTDIAYDTDKSYSDAVLKAHEELRNKALQMIPFEAKIHADQSLTDDEQKIYNQLQDDYVTAMQGLVTSDMIEDARKQMEEYQKETGIKMRLLTDISQLSKDELEAVKNGARSWVTYKGEDSSENDEVVFYLPKIVHSGVDLGQMFRHEVLSHHNLKNSMSEEKWNEFLDKVWNVMAKDEREQLDKLYRDKYKLDKNGKEKITDEEYHRLLADEFIATNAQNYFRGHRSTGQKIVDAVADWIRGGRRSKDPMARPILPDFVMEKLAKVQGQKIERKTDDKSEGTRNSVAYHGSGADFDKFDHSFMSTGEGSQVYGWGTYVSTNPETSKVYANISGIETVTYEGEKAPTYYGQELADMMAQSMWQNNKTFEQAKQETLDALNSFAEKDKGRSYDKEIEFISNLKESDFVEHNTAGRMLYTVEIPDDNGENYLHWDKPITDSQSDKIVNALLAMPEVVAEYGEDAEREVKSSLGHGTYGKNIEGALNYFLGDEKNYATDEDPGAERNSKFLNSLGFVGMQVAVDRRGGKRYDGDNYVIYNPDDIQIKDKTRFSIQDEETNDVFNRAIEEYGTTEDSNLAGYMLPDGRYLDFSEGSGMRTLDHRNVGMAYEGTVDEKYEYMNDFMKRGAIRIMPEGGGFELAVAPTFEQKRTLRQFIAERDGDVFVDFLNPDGGNPISAEYYEAEPSRVLADIDRYFNEGVKPISDERYSIEEESPIRYSLVVDPELYDQLESGEKEKGYRNVTLNEDGTLGSPMAGRLGRANAGSVATSSFELGNWEQSEENPDMADENGKINLIKPDDKGEVRGVNYNPYIHIRPTAVNKQFTQAWNRPELVYIETEYPTSELTSGYKAEKANLPVGRHKWSNGDLILSRYDKPMRIVPWEEVADQWVKEFKKSGVTFDIVPPALLPILAERGVTILPPKKAAQQPAMEAYNQWREEQTGMPDYITDERDGEMISEETPDNTTRFSLSTWENGGREDFIAFLDKQIAAGVLPEDARETFISKMDETYKQAKKIYDSGDFETFNEWSDLEVARDSAGNSIYTVIKPNNEYGMNLDFSLVCKKRRTLNAVLNEMIDRDLIKYLGSADGDLSIARINELIRNYGFETACRLCFVDAKRFRQVKVADDFVQLYNGLVNKLIPRGSKIKATFFDFARTGRYTDTEQPLNQQADDQLNISALQKIVNTEDKKKGDEPGRTVTYKIAKHLLENPQDRQYVQREDFMSTRGFGNVKAENRAVLGLYNAKKGSGGPKVTEGDVQYLGDVAKAGWSPEEAFKVGGVRIQSFSDYVPHMVFDYIQMVADLAAGKFPAHAYTKEELFAKMFGRTGIKINLSLVPAVAEDGVAAGLDKDGNYVWQENETFPFDEAIAIQNTEGYRENCGTIAVGVSDEQILKMLADEDIRMVIPYHKSGLNKKIAVYNNIDKFTDYTKSQNTRYKDGKKLSKSDAADEPNFNELLQREGDPNAAAQAYLDWCTYHDYLPKFDQFAYDDKGNMRQGYYKLLEDFTTYVPNAEGGHDFYPQRAITLTLPEEGDAFGSSTDIMRRGMQEDEELTRRQEAMVKPIVDEIQKMLTGEEPQTRYSIDAGAKIDIAKGVHIPASGKAALASAINWQSNVVYKLTNKLKDKEEVVKHILPFGNSVYLWSTENGYEFLVEKSYTISPENEKKIRDLYANNRLSDELEAIDSYIQNNTNGERRGNRLIEHLKREASRSLSDMAGRVRDAESETSESAGGNQTVSRSNGVVTPEQDAEYRKAFEDKDTEKAMQMLKAAFIAKYPNTKVILANGEPQVVYHGTPSPAFTTFAKPGVNLQGLVWLSQEEEYAGTYAMDFNEDENKDYSEPYAPQDRGVYQLFANIVNPLNIGYIEDVVGSDTWNELASKFGMTPEELFDRIGWDGSKYENSVKQADPIYELTRGAKFVSLLKENGYDGVEAWEGDDQVATFGAVNSNQVKSAEPFVLDDNGNLIPLSERFTESDDIRYSIIGEVGASRDHTEEGLTRLENLNVAREMEEQLKPDWSAKEDENALKIKMATGWERGGDGKWRYEIPDAQFKNGALDKRWGGKTTLGDIVDAPELFAMYPSLKDIKVKRETKRGLDGRYVQGENTMYVSTGDYNAYQKRIQMAEEAGYSNYDYLKRNAERALNQIYSTLTHELQHSIQAQEGFARGGTSSMLRPGYDRTELDRKIDEFNRQVDQWNNMSREERHNAHDFSRAIDRLGREIQRERAANVLGLQGYRRLAGETEARNASTRREMTAEQKHNSLLASTEDVARPDQIYIYRAVDNIPAESERFSVANENQAIFVSNAARAVEKIQQEKATPQQWLAMLQKNGGIKAGEDKWLGLSQWLKEQDGKISKNEILEFIDQNGIKIEETQYIESIDMLEETEKDASNRIVGGKSIEELQEEINLLQTENRDEVGGMDGYELDEWLMEQMIDRYGDDFEIAYYIDGGKVDYGFAPWDVDEYTYNSEIAGTDKKKAHSTRLGYTSKGLDNKREIALTVPTIEPWMTYDDVHFGDAGEGRAIAWIRFGDARTEGDRVLFIDEIQSKRHQEGRERGYMGEVETSDLSDVKIGEYKDNIAPIFDSVGDKIGEIQRSIDDYAAEENQYLYHARIGELENSGRYAQEQWALNDLKRRQENDKYKPVPAAPFEKNWQELAMKRMLRLAAEEGYDKIAWTPGEQQADRYKLAKIIPSITRKDTKKSSDKGIRVFEMNINDEPEKIFVNGDGTIVNSTLFYDSISDKPLSDFVGKDIAIRMMSMNDGETIDTSREKVGGDGMKTFYDQMLVNFMNKYGKQWGVKVEDLNLPDVEDGNYTFHSINVTDQMKKDVMEGQTMFSIASEQDAEYRKAYEEGDTEKAQQMVADAFKAKYPNAKVVDENGNPLIVYRGGSPMNIFNPEDASKTAMYGRGYYTTPHYGAAEEYSVARTGEKNNIQPVYLNVENPFVETFVDAFNHPQPISDDVVKSLIKNLEEKGLKKENDIFYKYNQGKVGSLIGALSDAIYDDIEKPAFSYWNASDKVRQALIDMGYDGVIGKYTGEFFIHPQVVAYYPSQIKSAEPFTFDDDGNLIPLSERFNDENNDIRYSFVGEQAASNLKAYSHEWIMMSDLNDAKAMERLGRSKEWIKSTTGWERGADGKWRYEMEDLELNDDFFEAQTIGDAVKESRLLTAYPELNDAKVLFKYVNPVEGSWFNSEKKEFYIEYSSPAYAAKALAHEIQHYIQEREGFAEGTSPEFFDEGKDLDYLNEVFSIDDDSSLKNLLDNIDDSKKDTPKFRAYNSVYALVASGYPVKDAKAKLISDMGQDPDSFFGKYKRTAGEVEARNVQRRMNLSLADRLATLASATEDVAREDQIIMLNGAVQEYKEENEPIMAPLSDLTDTRYSISLEPSNVRSEYNDGDIVVYNPRDIADIQAAVMRESYTHKDIRSLDGWDEFMDDAYRMGSKDIVDRAMRNGFDFGEATEHWVFENAERMTAPFEKMMSGNGIDLRYSVSGDEIRMYLIKREGLLDDIDLMVMREDLPTEPSVRFSTTGSPSARDLYDASQQSALNNLYRAYIDYSKPLRDFQAIIAEESGTPIKDYENAWEAENQRSSKSKAEIEKYEITYFEPMRDAVKALQEKADITYEEVLRYLIAKHGLERNVVLAMRDAEAQYKRYQQEHPNGTKTVDDFFNENRKRDYSGLTTLSGNDDVADAEDYARALVDVIERDAWGETGVLWKAISDATKAIQKKRYESGLISKHQMENEQKMFNNYIPLRGFAETIAEDVYEYYEDEMRNRPQRDKKAKGRTSLADDPLATIGAMAASAITQGNKNLVKQRFLNMVENHPTDLATVKEVWVVNTGTPTDPEWSPEYPDIHDGMTADEITQELEDYANRMAALENMGMAKKATNKLDIKWRTLGQQAQQHIITVRRGGKEQMIIINGNPQVARTVNGINNPDATLDKGLRGVRAVMRFMAANFTTRNPAFVVSNLLRDYGFATLAVRAKESPEYQRKFMQNLTGRVRVRGVGAGVFYKPVQLGKLINKWKGNTLDDSIPVERYFGEFMNFGGETGYTAENTVDAYRKKMQKGLKDKKGIVKGAEAILDFFELMNRSVEDYTRFMTYMTSREMGRSIQRSIADAKNITVNFNRKGSGEMGQQYIASAYLFFNAGMQSLQNVAKISGIDFSLDADGKKIKVNINGGKMAKSVSILFGSQVMLGMLIPMLNEFMMGLIGGDDDDDPTTDENGIVIETNPYRRLTEFERRNNVCLWIGGDNFIKIPIAIELRAFYGLGETIYGYMAGIPNPNPGKDVVAQMTDLLPVNFVERGGLVPDAFAPFVESFVTKENYQGIPLYNDSEYLKYKPESEKVYSGTGETYIAISRFINRLAGGDEVHKSDIDGAWNNPAVMQHLVEGYFGGVLTTFRQTAGLIGKPIKQFATGEEVDPIPAREWPVVNRLYINTDKRNDSRYVKERYYYYRDKADQMKNDIREYEKRLNDPEYEKKYNELISSPEYLDYIVFGAYDKAVKDAKEDVKEYGEEYKQAEVDAMRELVNALDETPIQEAVEELGRADRRKAQDAIDNMKEEELKEKMIDPEAFGRKLRGDKNNAK